MDRLGWKTEAKGAMKEAAASPYWATVIVGSISLILAGIQAALDKWQAIVVQYRDFSDLGQFLTISLIFIVVNFLISTWIQFGYMVFCMKVANRDRTVTYSDLFPSVKFWLKAMGLQLMLSLVFILFSLPAIVLIVAGEVMGLGLFTFLGALAFIPVFIAVYAYTQSSLVFVENPSKKIIQCLRESRKMMKGNKWEYFVLELSFIPWSLLAAITCMLASIYVMPYMTITEINFYNDIKPRDVLYQETVDVE